MKVIITHSNADFDAIASQVAASKLYPGSVILVGRSLMREVRDFLALHKNLFPTLSHEHVDYDTVELAILVDGHSHRRFRDFDVLMARIQAGEVPAHVYDHHPDSPGDLPAVLSVVEPLGAAVTLLVERLRERQIDIDPVEATLFALGIYADTGSLTYAGTTPRDMQAAAWLLARGASLTMLRRYLHAPMRAELLTAFRSLLGAGEEVLLRQKSVSVGISMVPLVGNVNGLSRVTQRVMEMEGWDALFALWVLPKQVVVIGRSRVRWLNVGEILGAVGGGGNDGAGSARVKGESAERVRARLLERLRSDPPRPRRCRDVMSTPVVTVDVKTSVEDAAQRMRRRGFSGLPVLRNCALSGIVSLGDCDAAQRDGRAHLPVGSCMAHTIHTVGCEAPLEEALETMVKADIGRLPVIDDGQIVGIVTRTDIQRALYG